MAVERADADAGAFRDGLEARVRAAGAENLGGRFEQTHPIARRIGTGLAPGFFRFHCHFTALASIPLQNGGTLRIIQFKRRGIRYPPHQPGQSGP